MTRLYDTSQQKFISKVFEGGYKVDGKSPELPDGIVELEIIIQEPPEINPETQRLKRLDPVIDTKKKTYTEGWQVIDLTDYEIAMRDWLHPQHSIRLVSDTELVLTDFGLAIKAWCELHDLPIIRQGDKTHIYCDHIREQFQPAVDAYIADGRVTIEHIPTPPTS